jgi:hypothetical protein
MIASSGSKKKTRARVLENPTFIQPPLLLQTLTTWSFYPDPLVQTLCVNSTISIQSRVLLLSSCPARPCPALLCLALLSGVEPSASLRSFAPAVAPAPPRPFPEAFKLPLQGGLKLAQSTPPKQKPTKIQSDSEHLFLPTTTILRNCSNLTLSLSFRALAPSSSSPPLPSLPISALRAVHGRRASVHLLNPFILLALFCP